ncbi:hypothetical protein [Nocardia tenerifensis]|nr:hypothetical protein [Nocardia tenerifensis]
MTEPAEAGNSTSWSPELRDYLVVARKQFERTGRPVDTADLFRAAAMTISPQDRFSDVFRAAAGSRTALASAYYNVRRGAIAEFDRVHRLTDPGPRPTVGIEVPVIPEAVRPITRHKGGMARALAFTSDVTRLSYALGAREMQLLYLQLCCYVVGWLFAGYEILHGASWLTLFIPVAMATRPSLLGWKPWTFLMLGVCFQAPAPLKAVVAVNALLQLCALVFEVRLRRADSGYPDVRTKDLSSDMTRTLFGRWIRPVLFESFRSENRNRNDG